MDQYPPLPFELTITTIGYETRTIKISSLPAEALAISLTQKIMDMEEVTILSPEKDGWMKYGKEFMEEFIGYSSFAKECELLNKDAVQFWYDKKTVTLRVAATKPLKIRNNATGYLVTYWLEDFEKNYITQKVYFKGYSQFTALHSKKKKRRKYWAQNRLTAYNGSFNHFMRSLYKRNPLKEGFEIRKLIRVTGDKYGNFVPVKVDTVALQDTVKLKKLFREMMQQGINHETLTTAINMIGYTDSAKSDVLRLNVPPVLPDTMASKYYMLSQQKFKKDNIIVGYFDTKSLPADSTFEKMGFSFEHVSGTDFHALMESKRRKKIYDILYTDLIPIDSLITSVNINEIQLKYKDYLEVTYLQEMEEKAYLNRHYPIKQRLPDKQTSIISVNEDRGININANGNFYDPYDILVEKYWSYEKLDKLLPLDFESVRNTTTQELLEK